MAVLTGGQVVLKTGGAPIRKVTFSGTVKLSAVGVVRDIKGYKVGVPETVYETTSDGSGNWSLEIAGGSNDLFRIIAVGIDGENSQIYEHLSG